MLLRLLCCDDGADVIIIGGGGPAHRSFGGIIAIERIRSAHNVATQRRRSGPWRARLSTIARRRFSPPFARSLLRSQKSSGPCVRVPLPYFTNTHAPQCKRRWRFSAPIYNENITRRCRPYLYRRSSNRFRPTIEYEGGYDTTAGLCSVYQRVLSQTRPVNNVARNILLL